MDSLCLTTVAERQLDLFGVAAQPCKAIIAEAVRAEALAHRAVTQGVSAPTEEQFALGLSALPLNGYEWTDDHAAALREKMLECLGWLDDERTSQKEKQEWLEWVAVPLKRPSEIPREPFSFQVCCLSSGVDPEVMRERVLLMFAPQLIREFG